MNSAPEVIDLMDTDSDEEETKPDRRRLRSHSIPRSKRKKYSEVATDSSTFSAAVADRRTHTSSTTIRRTITAPSEESDDESRVSGNESSDNNIQVAAKKKAKNIVKNAKNTKNTDTKKKSRRRDVARGAKKHKGNDFRGIIQSERKKFGTPRVREEATDSSYASEMFGSRILIDNKNYSSKRQNSQIERIVEDNGVHYELFYTKFVSRSGKKFDYEDNSKCLNVFLFFV